MSLTAEQCEGVPEHFDPVPGQLRIPQLRQTTYMTSEMTYHCGVSLSEQHTAVSWSQDVLLSAVSPAKAATVATHAWAKLHTETMS